MIFYILLILIFCFIISYLLATLISKSKLDKILYSLIILLIIWLIGSQFYLYFYESIFENNSSLLKAMYLILPIPYVMGLVALLVLIITRIYQYFCSS